MQILQAYPFTFNCGFFDGLESNFILSTTHRHLVIAGSSDDLLGKLLQLRTGVRTRGYDEQNWLCAGRFWLIQVSESKWCRLYILVAKWLLDEQPHSWFKSIRTQNLDDNQFLEGAQSSRCMVREFEFRFLRLTEFLPHSFVFQLKFTQYLSKGVAVHTEDLLSVGLGPAWQSYLRLRGVHCGTTEEFPFVRLK